MRLSRLKQIFALLLSNIFCLQAIAIECSDYFQLNKLRKGWEAQGVQAKKAKMLFGQGESWRKIKKTIPEPNKDAVDWLKLQLVDGARIPEFNHYYKIHDAQPAFGGVESLEEYFAKYGIADEAKRFFFKSGNTYIIDAPAFLKYSSEEFLKNDVEWLLKEAYRIFDSGLSTSTQFERLIKELADGLNRRWISEHKRYFPPNYNLGSSWKGMPPFLKEARFFPVKRVIEELVEASGHPRGEEIFTALAKISSSMQKAKGGVELSELFTLEKQFGKKPYFRIYKSEFFDEDGVYLNLSALTNGSVGNEYHFGLIAGKKRFDGKLVFAKPDVSTGKGKAPLAANGLLFKIKLPRETINDLERIIEKRGVKTRAFSCMHSACSLLDQVGVSIAPKAGARTSKKVISALFEGDVAFQGQKLGRENVEVLKTSEALVDHILKTAETADFKAAGYNAYWLGIYGVGGGATGVMLYQVVHGLSTLEDEESELQSQEDNEAP